MNPYEESLRRRDFPVEVTLLDDFESTQLVTGGLGGLGLVTASALCAPWHGRREPKEVQSGLELRYWKQWLRLA